MSQIQFPEDFLWGAATAAYQIEGASIADGRGESIWDRFCHTPGKVLGGDTGDVACDHYHRFREDVELMRWMGLKAYRFSIAWTRVQPDGMGAPNQPGLDFYGALVDALLAAGITPMATLYHWDLPQALEQRGGWSDRDIKGRFADYAALVARRLGDRVKLWATLNEPQVFVPVGYLVGEHAPGVQDPARYFQASHHVNLAHGLAVQALRDEARDAQVGTVFNITPFYPANDRDEDYLAAERLDSLVNRWYTEAALLGSYPEDALNLIAPLVPMQPGDLARIHQPLDWVGLNVYTRLPVCHDPTKPLIQANIDLDLRRPGSDYTAMGWEVHPPCIYQSLMRFKDQWGDPLVYITENGCAVQDNLVQGEVHDPARVDYLRRHLEQVRRAMDDGVKVGGYFVWSLLDNFEWALGYDKRFGLIHVDFKTLRRTPKGSAGWYRRVIAEGGFEV